MPSNFKDSFNYNDGRGVVGMGIGVIQGYYYAKAIPLEEYKIFIKSNTAIKYKAAVK